MADKAKRIFLTEDEMPKQWYNVRADMKIKPAPLIHPGTHEPLTVEQYAIAMKKDSELAGPVNKVLGELVSSGKIDELVEKHMALAAEAG